MAAGEDPSEIIVAPSGTVFVAPLGTAEPTTEATALNAAFKPLGLIEPAGATFTDGTTKGYVDAWQRFQHVKTLILSKDTQVSFGLLQWNNATLRLAFGGVVTQPTTGHFKFEPGDPADGADERCMILGWSDETSDYRLVMPRVTLAAAVNTSFVRSAAATLPMTFDILGPETGQAFYMLSNNAAWGS